ncbi:MULTISPECIES: two-component system sensor histidine kinase CreC [unclassified Lysobacter]|uniref:two-component system sensor histidine kinase CreC n=1 Tax=unclassified Lysobacter TaxID=2635362 RepID=UPI0006F6FBA4|nr:MULTISPECIES: two-component system sensor histidine kinase CreC [unclassified Lysobacter]KQZ55871.1 histidine kinase [Lysobacter sp. Root559]KRC32064.1 histidine kinase [Lysobacter sp. Root76]KRD67527.1 histidine kinase [Lysobacter sp. Root96]
MKIGLRIFLGYFVIVALAALLLTRVFLAEVKPGVRQAMEDTLVDTANVLAELATDDFLAGRINDGNFARRVRELRGRDFGAAIWGFGKRASNYRVYITDARGTVVFDSTGQALGRDYSRWNDVYLTLRGRYGARSTAARYDDPNSTVMHVAAPIRDPAGRIIGSLTVAKPNSTIAPFIERSQRVVLRWGGVLMGAALLIGLIATWWLSRQLNGLRRYAHEVSAGRRAELPAAAGEFGELGRALESMRTQLEGKQYVEQYVHTLTHEMKSPLAAIRGSAELLETRPGEAPMAEEDRARFAASIRRQSDRLAQMIDKLLALAAVEHRQRLEKPEPVDLAAIAREAAEQCAPRLAQGGLRLTLDLAEELPLLDGDPFLLRQALVNLIDNAADFSPAQGEIALRLYRDGDAQRVDVGDRGTGVPDFALPRVFERFYSLSRPAGGSRSSGLGLCFVAEVAALHGGHAALRNRDGGGALASLVLSRGL